MNILKLFLIIKIIKICHPEFIQVFHPFNPPTQPVVPLCPPPQQQSVIPATPKPLPTNTTAVEKPKDILKFLLPFMDMEIEYDRNIHIMQEQQKQQIYILHGHELYQMFIGRQEKRLSLVALLEGSVRHVEPLGAKIIYWQGNLLLVIALDEYLEVYQLAEDVLIQRAEDVKDPARANEPPPVFEAIQQLTLTGRFQKLFLFSPAEERIMIVAAVNFTKLYGKFRTFEWFNTYFDPVEEITVPAIHVVNVVGTQTKYLVTGRAIKHQTKTILTVYEISPPALHLQAKQTLTVQSRVVHIFTYRHRNMIVACSGKQQKCSSFRQMPDGHFSVYRHRTSKEFAFDLLTSNNRFVGATRQDQIMIFTNHRLDCYGSFVSDQKDITDLMGHQNVEKEDYVILVYKRPFKVLMRIVELEINVRDLATANQTEPEEILASTRHQHLFEATVGQLRSVLLQRKMDMDVLRKVSQIVRPRLKEIEETEPTTLNAGNVGIIKIVGDSLRSPQEILQKISQLRQTYLPQRSKRSDNQGPYNISLELTNHVKVNRMKVKNLIYSGNVMEGFSLNRTNPQQPVLYIIPKVTTQYLNTSELILNDKIRQIRQHNIPDLFFDLTPSIHVNHLKVEFINGESWKSFYDSIFLKNRDKVLKGRLVLQSQVNVQHLKTTILNGLTVSNLFNLKHPQIIHSDLVISRFFVHDLKAKTVNGLNFEEDIVFSGDDTFIKTPVIMHHLSISGDLIMSDNTKVERLLTNPDEIELKQFYTNRVIINGSLIVNNLRRENNTTKIILGDQEFDEQEIKEKYLLREQEQNFSFPIIFDEAKVTAPYLDTNFLNDQITDQHMLVNKVNSKKPLLVVFMNAQVEGDVMCLDYKSKIAEIKENIIRPGDQVNITGIKTFEEVLDIKEVKVTTLNGKSIEDLVFKTMIKDSSYLKFKDFKTFTSIKVKNPAFVEKELQASYLNNLPLEDLLNNDYYMDRLYVPHLVDTSNIVFHKINGIPFDEFFNKLNVKEERLVLHKDLIVEGNIQFSEPLDLLDINDIKWPDYVENLVRINENSLILGEVSFLEDLTVTKEFDTTDINGSDLELILNNVLMKSRAQLITGSYQFKNMNVSNLDVPKINNVKVLDFIDLSENLTEILGNVIVNHLRVKGSFEGQLKECENLLNLEDKIVSLLRKPWKNLYVLHNVSWPSNVSNNADQDLLKYFYKSAVKSNQDQIITGNVKISKPLITKMQTRLKFPGNLDIDFIYQDALFKNSSVRQLVKGKKSFLKTLYMENLQVHNNLNTINLNNIDILRFNQSLYRLTSFEPVEGKLKFLKPLNIGHLQVKGLINGLNTSYIYQLLPNTLVPAVQLQELYIAQDLYIKHINSMNLEYFFENRLTLRGPTLEHFGVLTFDDLIIEKEALIQSINGIPLDNLIFKHSPFLQTITGHKILKESLELQGPSHIMHLNDKDLMELYRNSLIKHNNYQFDNLIIDQATFESGLQVVRNLNSHYQQRSFSVIEDLALNNNKENFLKFLKDFKQNLSSLNKDILYLDYDLETSIKWQNPKGLNINKTLLHPLSRISCCEKVYLKISYQFPQQYYLQNITSTYVSAISNRITVKAENYCKYQYRKVKSKVTITGSKLLKVFGMKRFIETIYIFEQPNSTDQLIILHALDMPAFKRNEVRIFKISKQNNSISDWQGLTQNIGEQLKFYKFSNIQILLTNGLIDHHPALTIYHYNFSTQLFKLQQIIDGDYDIMEMFEIPNSSGTQQLILSCSKCQRIFIYEFNSSPTSRKYEIYQIISLKSAIDKLLLFAFQNHYYMLVISQRDSHVYNIYKYSYTQGWRHLTFGYFPNLQMSIPLTDLWLKESHLKVNNSSQGIPLILLCNLNDCYLVKAII